VRQASETPENTEEEQHTSRRTATRFAAGVKKGKKWALCAVFDYDERILGEVSKASILVYKTVALPLS
jgi:hypothetical protein